MDTPPDTVRTVGLNDDIEGVLAEFSETLDAPDQAMPSALSENDDLISVPDSVPDSSLPDTFDKTAKETDFDFVEDCRMPAEIDSDDISVREEEDDTSSSDEEEILSEDEFAEDDLVEEAD